MSRSTSIGNTETKLAETFTEKQVKFICEYWYRKGYKEGMEEAGLRIIDQNEDTTKH